MSKIVVEGPIGRREPRRLISSSSPPNTILHSENFGDGTRDAGSSQMPPVHGTEAAATTRNRSMAALRVGQMGGSEFGVHDASFKRKPSIHGQTLGFFFISFFFLGLSKACRSALTTPAASSPRHARMSPLCSRRMQFFAGREAWGSQCMSTLLIRLAGTHCVTNLQRRRATRPLGRCGARVACDSVAAASGELLLTGIAPG